MWDHDPVKTDTRRARRRQQLGDNPQCILCGFTEPVVLKKRKVRRRHLHEEHHVAGRANDEFLTVVLCLNCHALMHERYRTAGVPLDAARTLLKRVVGMLWGVGVFLPELGERSFKLGLELNEFIELLDEHFPGWQNLEDVEE